MRTTEARCDAVRRRVREMARSRRNRRTVALSAALCLMLVAALALALPRLTAGFSGAEAAEGTTASMFSGASLGYAAVGLLAFALGVSVTVLALRLRRRGEEDRDDD